MNIRFEKWIVVLVILLSLTGCSGTGFERKTAMLPDEIYISSRVNPEEGTTEFESDWVVGFKRKFK